MKMLHTCIRVKDLEASLDFYINAIGMVETRRIDRSGNGFILVYLSSHEGGYELELTYNFGSEGYVIGDGFSHIAVSVEDLEAMHKTHTDNGYEVTPLKGLPGNVPNYYFISDPDGYRVEIIRAK